MIRIIPKAVPVISGQPYFPAIFPLVKDWGYEKVVPEKKLIVKILSDGFVGEYQIGMPYQGVPFFVGFHFQMLSVPPSETQYSWKLQISF